MAAKRIRIPEAKPGQLIARWGRADRGDAPAVVYATGGGGTDRTDRRILCEALEGLKVLDDRNLVQELKARGYDITTLRFSIQKSATT